MNIQVLKMMFVKSLGFAWHVRSLQSSVIIIISVVVIASLVGTPFMCLVPGVVGVCGHKVAGLKIKFCVLSCY